MPCESPFLPSVETLKTQPHLLFVVARHGEPIEYGQDNAALTPRGRLQVVNTTNQILDSVPWASVNRLNIAFYHTGRPRTQQSALLGYSAALGYIEDHQLDKKVNLKPWSNLQTNSHQQSGKQEGLEVLRTDVLSKLHQELGVDIHDAYPRYMTAQEVELRDRHIKTPRDLADEALNAARVAQQWTTRRSLDDTLLIAFAHETTVGAIAKQAGLFTEEEREKGYSIGFAEPLFIDASQKDIIFRFRNRFGNITSSFNT